MQSRTLFHTSWFSNCPFMYNVSLIKATTVAALVEYKFIVALVNYWLLT